MNEVLEDLMDDCRQIESSNRAGEGDDWKRKYLEEFSFWVYNSNDNIEEYQVQIQLLQRSP